MTPVMYLDSSGESWKSIWESVKKWYEEDLNEIWTSIGASFFVLTRFLPNKFAFATSKTVGGMAAGLGISIYYLSISTLVIYGTIKLIQLVISNTQIVEPGLEDEEDIYVYDF